MKNLKTDLTWQRNQLEPQVGEIRVIDGKLAMCVSAGKTYGGWSGPLWAIEGLSCKLTYVGRSIKYDEAICTKVDPVRQEVSFYLLRAEKEATKQSGESLTLPVDAICRLDPEYPSWKARAWGDERAALYIEGTLKSDGVELAKIMKHTHTETWRKLLGDAACGELLELLHKTRLVSDIIKRSQGNCTLMPSPKLKQLIKDISNQLGLTGQKMNTNTELSCSEQSAYGAVLGALLGDAAGGVLEFLGRQPTPAECEDALSMPGGGVLDLAPGQFTDDGEMTVSLLRALVLAEGKFDLLKVAQCYNGWLRSSPFDIGNATSSALQINHFEAGGTNVAELIIEQAKEYNSESKANGSLMRATPLGILGAGVAKEEAIRIARMDSSLTHPNPSCQAATVAYVLAIRHLIQQPGDHKGAFLEAKNFVKSESQEVMQWLDEAAAGNLPPAHPMAGFVRYAFTYAFHYLHEATSFKKAILETLARGGDTDTNACIVGGLLGALHGVDKLPVSALEKVFKCNTNYGQARPELYTIKPVMGNLKKLCHYCLG